jgi:hypothetical protein
MRQTPVPTPFDRGHGYREGQSRGGERENEPSEGLTHASSTKPVHLRAPPEAGALGTMLRVRLKRESAGGNGEPSIRS